jgi:hypothetical protein
MAPGASSSISTPLWSLDKAQDLYPNSCLPFFLPGIQQQISFLHLLQPRSYSRSVRPCLDHPIDVSAGLVYVPQCYLAKRATQHDGT